MAARNLNRAMSILQCCLTYESLPFGILTGSYSWESTSRDTETSIGGLLQVKCSRNDRNFKPKTDQDLPVMLTEATMLALLESPCLTDLKLNLRAASMETLVEQCVLSFPDDNESPEEPLSALPSALFLVHKWYIYSSQLCSLFLHLSRNRRQLLPGVCRTIKYWMSLFPEHFDNDAELCKCVDDIRKEAFRNGYAQLGETLDTNNIPSYSWMRNISVRNLASRQVSLSFEQWMPEDIAVNLTHIEYKLLRRITFAEYKEYANSCQLRSVPKFQRSIAVFNRKYISFLWTEPFTVGTMHGVEQVHSQRKGRSCDKICPGCKGPAILRRTAPYRALRHVSIAATYHAPYGAVRPALLPAGRLSTRSRYI
uniref:Uncharacterized protein n=1 Tax=Romanomermis culicivorax TaxID=13658 RepID=A0A915HPE9_ROMCU